MQQVTPCFSCPLRTRPIFKANTREEIAFIQQYKAAEPRFRAGAALFHEGQGADRLFTLLRGWAFRFKTLADGRRQILNILLPGDLIGLQAKLFDKAPHGVEALTDVGVCAFSRERTWELFRQYPALAFDLTWLSAHEERLVDDGLLSVGRRTAAEGMAMLVLHLWHRAKHLDMVQAAELPFPLTQLHIADVLGLSAVHTNRTLQSLRRQKLFDLSSGVLRDVKEDRLKRLSRYDPVDEQRPLF